MALRKITIVFDHAWFIHRGHKMVINLCLFLHHHQTFVKNGEGNKRGEGGNKRKNLFSLVLK